MKGGNHFVMDFATKGIMGLVTFGICQAANKQFL